MRSLPRLLENSRNSCTVLRFDVRPGALHNTSGDDCMQWSINLTPGSPLHRPHELPYLVLPCCKIRPCSSLSEGECSSTVHKDCDLCPHTEAGCCSIAACISHCQPTTGLDPRACKLYRSQGSTFKGPPSTFFALAIVPAIAAAPVKL